MSLKIFTPAQARSSGEQRIAKDALRAQSLAETTRELLATKSEVEKEFEETMKKKRIESEKWFEETVEKKNKLLEEVKKLEEQRKQALSPLLISADDIHSTEQALQARSLELDERSRSLEENSRLLMSKLDAASSKAQDLSVREKRVKTMELGAETQRKQIAESARLLNAQMVDFHKKIEDKETAIAFKESELDARKNLYDQNDQQLIAREKEIESAMRLLADQRVLLRKGFDELRNKNNNL